MLHTMLVCFPISTSQQDLPGYAEWPEPTSVSVSTPFLFRSSSHGCVSLILRPTVLTAPHSVFPIVAKVFPAVEFLADCNQLHNESPFFGITTNILTIPRLPFGDQTKTLIWARFAEIFFHCYQYNAHLGLCLSDTPLFKATMKMFKQTSFCCFP